VGIRRGDPHEDHRARCLLVIAGVGTDTNALRTGCKRHTVIAYDTTKIPPVWSSGSVTCSG
jgi:hypothetical protein